MKKTALALALVLTILVIFGVHLVSLVEANFYPFGPPYKEIDPIPGTIPPKITILSPTNHTTYSGRELNLAVIVTGPETPYRSSRARYTYYFLDGHDLRFSESVDIEHIDVVLPKVRNGTHELLVSARYMVVVREGVNERDTVFFIESNSSVFFTINIAVSSSTPLSTQEYQLNLSSPQETAVLSGAIAIVGIGLLANYFKKRQRSQSP
jgi:hypothetical protein